MATGTGGTREGSLEAPTRHPLAWRESAFWDERALEKELERVFDICHGCRRCFSLCQAFPTLFDAIDESPSGELAGVPKTRFAQVADHCYLCDMCYMTKCPYVPPHEWAVDFPHLMLRAKAVKARAGGTRVRDRVLAATDVVGRIAGIPVVAQAVNAVNATRVGRVLLEKALGVARDAPLPAYHSRSARSRLADPPRPAGAPEPAGATSGRVAIFATCYGDRNEPELVTDLAAVLAHNGIEVRLVREERCCGMPRLELGDLEAVARAKEHNLPRLLEQVDAGYDILAPIPSCVLMFKQELPLMFPEDEGLKRLRGRLFDPFEYLMLRHAAGKLRTDFKGGLGKVAYHVPCHLRVQNLGLKTRDLLRLVPGTTVEAIERCSGHDGTYGVKREFRAASMKIAAPVVAKVAAAQPDHYASDCPMAGHQIGSGLPHGSPPPEHPLRLLRLAYGL